MNKTSLSANKTPNKTKPRNKTSLPNKTPVAEQNTEQNIASMPNKTPNKTSSFTKVPEQVNGSAGNCWGLLGIAGDCTAEVREQNTEQNKVREMPPNKTPNKTQLSIRTLNAEQNKHRTKTKKFPNKTPNTEHCSLNTEHRSGPVLFFNHIQKDFLIKVWG